MPPAVRPFLVVALGLLAFLPACGGGGGGGVTNPVPPEDGCVTGTGPEVLVTGTVRYQRLVLSALGLGPALETNPCRYVDVRIRAAGGGTCYGETSTDQNGDFSVLVRPPSGSSLEVQALSRTNVSAQVRVTVHDALPPVFNVHTDADTFRHTSPSFPAGSAAPVVFTVPYNPGTSTRPSIGFGTLDVLVTCSEAIRTSTGVTPPQCHAYTRLGNNGATGTSFYTHGARALTLLGGASGNLDGSDTDYFDDGVIAHEYGHFVEFNMGHTLTRGGAHGGERLEPGFAWSEGHCTGFGCLCRKTDKYIDTTGTSGGILISQSTENWAQSVRGIGSEETCAEMVWDLGDGTGGIPDGDGDGVSVSLGTLYGTILGFSPQSDAPYLGLLLQRLVDQGAVSSAQVGSLTLNPENQMITWPLAGDDVWPEALPIPGSDSGTCNATTGNRCRGYDASRWYSFTLASQATLTFDLTISPINPSNNDLNLYLLRASGEELGRSTNGTATPESIGPVTLDPGTYLIRVEATCSGAGSHADYTLTVTS